MRGNIKINKGLAFGKYILIILILFSSTIAFADEKWNKRYNEITTNISFNPYPWAIPYGKEVNILVIGPRFGQRETAELAQRLEVTYSTVMLHNSKKLGGLNYGFRKKDVLQDLEGKLKYRYDAIIIGNISWSIIPENIRGIIFKKVSRGTGLIISNVEGLEVLPLKEELSTYSYKDDPYLNLYFAPQIKNRLNLTAKFYNYNKGRVVIYSFGTTRYRWLLTSDAKTKNQ